MKSFAHDIGRIFQPIYDLLGRILAFFYGIIPNYAVAIALLTVVIMGVLTPFTIKSTKSMIAMQKLQPELKKLQQKYKGPENRQLLNEEMMKLYKEEGVNPLGGCLPMLLQTRFSSCSTVSSRVWLTKYWCTASWSRCRDTSPPVPRCTTISCGPVVRSSPSAWTST